MLVVPDSADVLILNAILNNFNLYLHLYTNDMNPADLSWGTSGQDFSTSDFIECTDSGYAPVLLTSSNWNVSTTSGVATGEYINVTFTFGDNNNDIYGYYVTNDTDDIMWAERFDEAPVHMMASDELTILPKLTLS